MVSRRRLETGSTGSVHMGCHVRTVTDVARRSYEDVRSIIEANLR